MSAHSSPIPLYHQVASVLRHRISDGVTPPGARLEPEDRLAEEFGVSRATIRQAVGNLVHAGLLVRRQGSGTYVLADAERALGQAFRGSLGDLAAEVRRSRIRDVRIEHDVPVPPTVAAQLELEPPVATVVRRTRTMDGVAFAYTVNSVPPALGRRVTKRRLRTTSLMDVLEELGVVIESARQTVRAQPADATVSAALDVALGTPVLFVHRINLDADGRPIDVVETAYRGDLYEYTVSFAREGTDDLRSRLA